jgi:hypothetical protein
MTSRRSTMPTVDERLEQLFTAAAVEPTERDV